MTTSASSGTTDFLHASCSFAAVIGVVESTLNALGHSGPCSHPSHLASCCRFSSDGKTLCSCCPSSSRSVESEPSVGCGALVFYSNVEPDEVEVDGTRVKARWQKADGNLIVPLGPREGDHAVVVRF